MKHSFLLIAVLALAFAGCDSKKKKCDKVAAHLQEISDKEGANAKSGADYQICMDSYNDKQIDCAMAAKTSMDVVNCMSAK